MYSLKKDIKSKYGSRGNSILHTGPTVRQISEAEEKAEELRRETEEGERIKTEGEQLKEKLAACDAELKTYAEKIRSVEYLE